jgi:hypothetical protein
MRLAETLDATSQALDPALRVAVRRIANSSLKPRLCILSTETDALQAIIALKVFATLYSRHNGPESSAQVRLQKSQFFI